MRKVLITGAAGYIGKSLFKSLSKKDFEVLGIDKFVQDSKRILYLDLTDMKNLSSLIEDFEPDFIFHLGTNSAAIYERKFLSSYSEDLLSLVNILQCLKERLQTRLVFMSSNYVYSGLKDSLVVNEDTVPNPSHNFGISKHFFEKFILANHPNSIAFRLSNVYGINNPKNETLLSSWKRSINNGEKLFVWGKGQRKMQYINLRDVVSTLTCSSLLNSGIYNLGGSDYFSIRELTTILSDGFDIEIDFIPNKAERSSLPFMNTNKLLESIEKSSFISLKDGLYSYIQDDNI